MATVSRTADQTSPARPYDTPPDPPVEDKNYNLINILHLSLENAWRMEQFIADAEREGGSELADWFRAIQQNSRKAGEQGKQMLAQRIQTENT